VTVEKASQTRPLDRTSSSGSSRNKNNTDANCVADCMSLALDRRDLESAILALDRDKCVIFYLSSTVSVIMLVVHLYTGEWSKKLHCMTVHTAQNYVAFTAAVHTAVVTRMRFTCVLEAF